MRRVTRLALPNIATSNEGLDLLENVIGSHVSRRSILYRLLLQKQSKPEVLMFYREAS